MIAGLVAAIVVYRWQFRIQDWTRRWWEHNVLAQRSPGVFLGFMIIAYIVIFSTLSLLKHINLHTQNDLAIHAQVMWNTAQRPTGFDPEEHSKKTGSYWKECESLPASDEETCVAVECQMLWNSQKRTGREP